MTMIHRNFLICYLLTAFALAAGASEWTPPEIRLPAGRSHPVITLPPGGLETLRAELERGGSNAPELQRMIRRGSQALENDLAFPPRGGHHNQWYQCDDCQRPLRTVSETEHRCPSCDKVYSGEPYDDVVFRRTHTRNLQRMTEAAWAYALTGETRYAEFARDVLLGYAERYLTYPYRQASRADSDYARRAGGRLFDQTLTEAMYLLRNIAPAYDLIHDSGVMNAEDHRKLREGLLDPMIESLQRLKRGRGNWQSFHNAGLFWIAAVIGDEELLRSTVLDPEHGFFFQMEESITSDGMWYEGSWSYHFYTLTALARQAMGAGHLGLDLWSHPSMKRMFTLPVDYLMADGTLPRFGNATTVELTRFGRGSPDLMEAAYRAYGEPELRAMLPVEPGMHALLHGNMDVEGRGEIPPLPSVALRETGHAMLRTEGGAGLSAAFQFAPHGGFHAHFDQLSFVLFGHGRELGVDRGRAASQAYRLPIHRNWYRSTISHNTVLVDLEPQTASGGELLQFLQTPKRAAATARVTDAHPGVEHIRTLYQNDRYLLVFDRLAAGNPRRFDWFYHNLGERAVSPQARAETTLPEKAPGLEFLDDIRRGNARGTLAVAFEDDPVTTRVTMAGANSETVLTLADGPGARAEERVPLMFVTRRGRTAEFAAVIEPVRRGREATVSGVSHTRINGGHAITVDGPRGRETITIFDDHRIEVTDGR